MKVIFVCSGNTKFGVSPFVKAQAESLIAQNIEVSFFVIEGKGGVAYFKAINKLRKFVRNQQADIIHAHYTFSGWVAILSWTGLPIVLSLMGDDAYGSVNRRGKTKLSRYYSIVLTFLIQPFLKQIIAKSYNIARYVYRKEILSVIPNGVDFSVFKPGNGIHAREKLGLDKNTFYVLFLNNINDFRKNFELASNGFSIFQKKYPDVQLLTPYPVSHNEVTRYFDSSNVLLHTSLREGSPNLIKEAMAANCPIISTKVGDVVESIGNTKDCYTVGFDANEIADHLEKIYKRGFFRTDGRSRIDHLRSNNIAREIIRVYNKMI